MGDGGPRVVVLVTGDEVLEGRIADRNGRFLAGELYAAGADVVRMEFLGDRADELRAAVRRSLDDDGADLVVTTGGLGPTHDDLTMSAVGEAVDLPMEAEDALVQAVRARCATNPRWEELAHDIREGNVIKQATLPRGATPIPPTGTAPGAIVPAGGALVVVLPGPPSECVPMWRWAAEREPVAGLLGRGAGTRARVVHLAGLTEAELVEYLATVPHDHFEGLRMGICARAGELEITLRQPDGADRIDRLAGLIQAHYPRQTVSVDGRDTDAVVAYSLIEGGETVAVAESCTGGLLGARLTRRPGSSAYVLGGVIAYDNAVKTGVLGVPAHVIERHGAVSDECARAMAEGVRRLVGATYGVSVTGIAGPGGGTDQKPVGTVFVGVASPHGTEAVRLGLRGERDAIRERAVGHAMHALRRAVTAARG